VGAVGAIVSTNDGGNTWNLYPPVAWEWINSVFFTNTNTGYFVGNDGTILTTPASEFIVSTNEFVSAKSTLSVYPNPASDKIVIESDHIFSNATIEVFNLNGKQVIGKIFCNQNKTVIDVKMLAPGLYIVKMSSPSQIEIKKLIVK